MSKRGFTRIDLLVVIAVIAVLIALLMDGSVHAVKSTVNPMPWRAITSMAGGEVVSSDQD